MNKGKYILVNEKDLEPEAIEEFKKEGYHEIESEEIGFIKSDVWSAINNLENYPIEMKSVKEDIAKRKSLLEKLR